MTIANKAWNEPSDWSYLFVQKQGVDTVDKTKQNVRK